MWHERGGARSSSRRVTVWNSAAWWCCRVSFSVRLFGAGSQKKSQSDNGKTGTISGYNEEKGRYEVGQGNRPLAGFEVAVGWTSEPKKVKAESLD